MKTIGLIGGMSWESTVTYYQVANETIKERLGGFHSAKLLLYSVDFHELEAFLTAGAWDKIADLLSAAAQKLEGAGAECILICTNTMHKVAPEVQARIGIPLLHIADATAQALKTNGIEKAALLGTKYTVQQEFFKARLAAAGIAVLIPDAEESELLNTVIFQELCLGDVKAESKDALLRIIDRLAARGAQGVILGCTELGLMIGPQDTALPVFDTALIHAKQAARYALGEE